MYLQLLGFHLGLGHSRPADLAPAWGTSSVAPTFQVRAKEVWDLPHVMAMATNPPDWSKQLNWTLTPTWRLLIFLFIFFQLFILSCLLRNRMILAIRTTQPISSCASFSVVWNGMEKPSSSGSSSSSWSWARRWNHAFKQRHLLQQHGITRIHEGSARMNLLQRIRKVQ